MTDLRRVSGPTSRFDRQAGRIIVIAVVAILIAIIKPWGTPAQLSAVPVTTPRPTASPSPAAAVRPPTYDFLTFGTNEPQPGWELWPAGNLASFYFAMRIDMVAKASEAPEGSSAPTPIPIATPSPVAGPGGVPESWPTIHIPVGSDLDLLGLNRPIGYDIEIAALVRLADDGTESPVEFRLGRSPWPTHFTTVGFAAAGDAAGMEPWPPGHYRLDVIINPGGVARSVEIIIDIPRPAPSASPTVAASSVP